MKGGRRQAVLISVAGLGVLVAGADYLARRSDAQGRAVGSAGVAGASGEGSENGGAVDGAPATPASGGAGDAVGVAAGGGGGGGLVAGLDAALRALDGSAEGVGGAALDGLFGLGPSGDAVTADGAGAVLAGGAGVSGGAAPDVPGAGAGLRLTAVSTSGGGSAVINGVVYLVGEARGGVELLSVTGRTARVEAGGSVVVLVLE